MQNCIKSYVSENDWDVGISDGSLSLSQYQPTKFLDVAQENNVLWDVSNLGLYSNTVPLKYDNTGYFVGGYYGNMDGTDNFIRIDLGSTHVVKGVALRGLEPFRDYVSQFSVEYGTYQFNMTSLEQVS